MLVRSFKKKAAGDLRVPESALELSFPRKNLCTFPVEFLCTFPMEFLCTFPVEFLYTFPVEFSYILREKPSAL
jgi:hypothetical protein